MGHPHAGNAGCITSSHSSGSIPAPPLWAILRIERSAAGYDPRALLHDLRDPLSVILSSIDLLESHNQRILDNVLAEPAGRIGGSVARCAAGG
ncbi:MAG: hypothetical protein DCC53_07510 [Chloroflexi bacterium]|nr:MAG: hypothetical protein DCC53_07510 [Chloroflexota bacterium]